MKKKKKDERLKNLKKQIQTYTKHIPLANSFTAKRKRVTNVDLGGLDHYVTKITPCVNVLPFNDDVIIDDKIIKCQQIILLPDNDTKNILLGFINDYRRMYNEIVHYFKKAYWNNEKVSFNWKKVRNLLKTKKDKYSTPRHVLDGAIKSACASYKSALSNYKAGNIKHFTIRYIKKNKNSLVMDVENCYLRKKHIFKTWIKKELPNKSNYNYDTIKTDCKIHYNRSRDEFKLLVPIKTTSQINKKRKFVSIDMGLRTFITAITNNEILEIGTNMNKLIKKEQQKIDSYNTLIRTDTKYIKCLKKIIQDKKELSEQIRILKQFNENKKQVRIISKCKNKSKTHLRKREKKIREKLKNRVKDIHWKIINYLTNRYKFITLGNWSTKSCKEKKSVLDKKDKRSMDQMAVFQFRLRMSHKSKEKNVNYQLIDEYCTTQMCSYCAYRNIEIGASKVFDCPKCKVKVDRDVNSCRNMLLKGLKQND